MRKTAIALALVMVVGITSSPAAQATLIGRDLDGDPATFEAVYDTVLNLTWLADANYAKTQFDTSGGALGVEGGRMTWATATAWATGLNYYGITGWRLPIAPQPDLTCDLQLTAPGGEILGSGGHNCTGSEMGHLFYVGLGGTAMSSILTSGDPDLLALFRNIQALSPGSWYWTGTADRPGTESAIAFSFFAGAQSSYDDDSVFFGAWPVRPGDVAAIGFQTFTEIGDAGNHSDPMHLAGADTQFDRIVGTIGDDTDVADAFAFFFGGGDIQFQGFASVMSGDTAVQVPLDLTLYSWPIDPLLLLDPLLSDGPPSAGTILFNALGPGNYILEARYSATDPPYTIAITDPTTGRPVGVSAPIFGPGTAIPEPSSLALLGLGLASLAALRRRS